MKDMLEEYGGVIWAGLGASAIIGIIGLALNPGNQIYNSVTTLLIGVIP